MPTLTVSGNEVTDATRAAAAALGTASSGQMCDGRLADSSFGIRRAATNLFRRGQCDTVADLAAAAAGTTFATDATTRPPFSTQSVKVTCDGTAASQGAVCSSATGQNSAVATSGVGSTWFKGVAGQSYIHRVSWRNTDASSTFGTNTSFTATGAWQLLVPIALAVAAGKTGDRITIEIIVNGTRVDAFWLAHEMLEKGQAVVSPYVATFGGSTATHAAGRVQAPASLMDETQVWVAIRIRAGYPSTVGPTNNPRYWCFRDSGTEALNLLLTSGTGSFTMLRASGGSNSSVSKTVAFAAGDFITIIAYATATQIGISVNGSAFVVGANTFIPVLAASTFDVASIAGANQADSDVFWFACDTGQLTNAQAAQIAALSNTNPDFRSLGIPAKMVWPASTSAYEVPPANTVLPVAA